MAIINEVIGRSAFEVIRVRIGEIMATELEWQAVNGGDYDLDATVFVERCLAYDKKELPCVNISLARGTLDGQSAVSSDGTHIYHIDVFTCADSDEIEDGTSRANVKAQKLVGVCRAIFEHTKYKTLGFAAPFIMHRQAMDILFQDPSNKDGKSVSMARLRVSVKAPEFVGKAEPRVVDGYQTTVRLEESDQGYLYFTPAT